MSTCLKMFRRFALVGLVLAAIPCLAPVPTVCAQSDLAEAFDRTLAEWKQCAKNATIAGQNFIICDADDADELRQEWIEAVSLGRDKFDELVEIGLQRMRTDPVVDPNTAAFLALVLEHYFESGSYETAYSIGDALLKVAPDVELILAKQAMNAFATNRFDECRQSLERMVEHGYALPPGLSGMAGSLDQAIVAWERETELRRAEAEAEDLPRVELLVALPEETGRVVLELFENEAPGGVANFVSLVEQGFYDDRAFFRVVTHLDATTGCPNDDGTGDPGYLVASECIHPDARGHFRGSVSMVNVAPAGKEPREGSLFSILLSPNPSLDGRATVIGRVVEGMDVIDRLQRTHYSDEAQRKINELPQVTPTRTERARVIRKRDHEYLPSKVEP